MSKENQFLLYTAPDGAVKVEVFFRDETVWLTQALMAELFQVTVPTVNEHLKGIYAEGELPEGATIRKFRIVQPGDSTGNDYLQVPRLCRLWRSSHE